ncbi:ectoine hydrolase [Bradyrhizobium sp. F1.13.4]
MAMPKSSQAFPRSEYLRRLTEVKLEMKRREIDALVVTTPANITYLSGYTSKSGYVPQGLLVSLEDEEPTFITRRMDGPAAIHQMFIDRSRVIGYPEALIANPDRDGYDAIIDFLLDKGLGSRGIGLEAKFLPSLTIEKFRLRAAEARIVDCTNAVTWIRGLKSDLEIVMMREAAAISDAGMLKAKEVIQPGLREADAAAEIIATLVRGANGKPGTDLASFFMCSTPRTSTCHIRWTEDIFRPGSQINLEFSGVRHGYTSPLMRTMSIGRPADHLRRLHDGEVAGLEAALAAAQNGWHVQRHRSGLQCHAEEAWF